MSTLLDHAVQVLTFRGSSTGKLAESLGGDRGTVRDVEQARQAWRKRGRPAMGPREAAQLCLEFVRDLDARKKLEQALQSLDAPPVPPAPPPPSAEARSIEDRSLDDWKRCLRDVRHPGPSAQWDSCLALLSRTVVCDIGDLASAGRLWSVTLELIEAARHRYRTPLRLIVHDRLTMFLVDALMSLAEALVTAHPSLAAYFHSDPTHAQIHWNFRTDKGHFQPRYPSELVRHATRGECSEHRIASAWLDEPTPEDRMPLAETLAAMDTDESWRVLLAMVQEIPATDPEGAALRALRDRSPRAKAIPPPDPWQRHYKKRP